jgi:hypothetical protein
VVKVFFGCSLRGGYQIISREKIVEIVKKIESLGHILATKHQIDPLIFEKQKNFTMVEIHDLEYSRMIESDVGIFEVTNPSLGVGSEVSDMVYMGKPVLCLYKRDMQNLVSAQILGKEGSRHVIGVYECHAYETLDELVEIIIRFIETYLQDDEL